MNFTFEGLPAAAAAIERLRNFARRVENPYPDGRNKDVERLADEAVQAFHAGMDDDLNTALALAAVFDFVRAVTTKIAAGKFRAGNAADASRVLDLFDSIFDVLRSEQSGKVAAEEVEKLIAQRIQARRNRDFALADQIRDQLKADGVVLEDYQGGTRWHYADS